MKPRSKAKKRRARLPTNVPLAWFRSLPTPFFLLDSASRVIYANDAFIELTAYGKDEILGARLDLLFDPKDMRGALKRLLELYQGRPIVNEAHDIIRKTGHKAHVVMNVTPVYGRGAQRVTNALGIVLVEVKI